MQHLSDKAQAAKQPILTAPSESAESSAKVQKQSARAEAKRAADEYKELLSEAARKYAELPTRWRLWVTDANTLVSQAVCLIGFTIWWHILPPIRFGALSFIASAYAAPPDANPFDARLYINLGIFAALFLTFLVSLWVSYFSKSDKAADQANTVSKTLLGFFIGAGTSFLGIR